MRLVRRVVPLRVGPLIVLGVVGGSAPLISQERVETNLERLDPDNARSFVRPLGIGLALAMGGGPLARPSPLEGLDFEIGARVSATLPPRRADRYRPVLPESVSWNGTSGGTFDDPYRIRGGGQETPSVVGAGPGVVLEPAGAFLAALLAQGEDPADFELALPDGHDLPVVPHPTLFASLGIGIGTEVSLRFMPKLEVDEEVGSLRGLGFALRHSITHWFASPVDLSVLFARQEVELVTYLDATYTHYGLMATRRLGPLSVTASGLVRDATVDVVYEVDNPGDAHPALPPDGASIRFSEEVETDVAFGLGARLQLLILNVSAEYTLEDYPIVAVKVGFGTP